MSVKLVIRRPDDWHLHLRDNEMLATVLPYSSQIYGRAVVMPNLVPPLKTTSAISDYRERILGSMPENHHFQPLMTAYLSDDSDAKDLLSGYQSGVIKAVKLYPAHATTNSAHGVSSVDAVMPVLEMMQKERIPLLIHGEVTDSHIDVFDREARFIETILVPLLNRLPELKVVLEHATTKEAAEFVLNGKDNLAATITPQHLLLNRNALFQGGLRPHNYCLPILKREIHRQALVKAVTSGSSRFFLGTDSAPHEQGKKEGACGCAGAFNVITALSIYAHIFEQENALDKLEAFTSLNGPRFYGLPTNTETITLIKQPMFVPESIEVVSGGKLIPFLAGELLEWSIVTD
ncbi:dihydroorotase [Zophobihabitans entericus]|uniref:Dihydroorotase n=1 Tax=Zophobihabitans entericus TaxID=1635327 RepID=A0A6G9IDE0_9GAMM|nr:dihydroorotase [Zophobihabitans entericus]QIQ21829.1 dihydroorotase [Zophobihabitans entericus]